MASYSQWARTRPVRRATWVCGAERVLAAEVAAAVRAAVPLAASLDAATDPEADIWAAASQLAAGPELVSVRSAQLLRNHGQLIELVKTLPENPGRHLLFISDAADFPSTEDGLAPHLAVLRDSSLGQLVRCPPADPAEEPPEWLQEWASRQLGGAGRVLGTYLLERTGMDLRAALDVAGKLLRAGLEVTRDSISRLAQPVTTYTEALITDDRPAAMSAAAQLGPGDVARTVRLLASRLDTLSALHAASEQRADGRETALRYGVQTFLQRRYRDAARHYPPERVRVCRSVLAAADGALAGGADIGVAEFVAACWAR